MPVRKEELDEMIETPSITERMEPRLYYSIYELSEFILKKKIPEGKSEVSEYLESGRKKIPIVEAVSKMISIQCDLVYVQAVLYVLHTKGEIILGKKGGIPHFARA